MLLYVVKFERQSDVPVAVGTGKKLYGENTFALCTSCRLNITFTLHSFYFFLYPPQPIPATAKRTHRHVPLQAPRPQVPDAPTWIAAPQPR
jgi:hypothetical protein